VEYRYKKKLYWVVDPDPGYQILWIRIQNPDPGERKKNEEKAATSESFLSQYVTLTSISIRKRPKENNFLKVFFCLDPDSAKMLDPD
jgi:hypothetical protein